MFGPVGRKGFVSFWREGAGDGDEEQRAFLQTVRVLPSCCHPSSPLRAGPEGDCAAGIRHCSALGFACGSSRPLLPLAVPLRCLTSLCCGTVMAFSSELRGFGLK